MKKSKQAGKYILSDFISASVAWLLFNILRYEVFAIDEGADSLLDYLQYPGVLTGQINAAISTDSLETIEEHSAIEEGSQK